MLSDITNDYANNMARTVIYRTGANGETALGYIDAAGVIYRLRWDEGIRVGRVTPDNRIMRDARYDERELGAFTDSGSVHSNGLFEGGALGWVETDGVVVRGGLIFGEEEVGRVEGIAQVAAGAALLLLFLVDEQEETNRSSR